jgi:predicted phage-related endonuclease
MTIQIIRPADRQAWLAARSKDVTASVAAAVLGAHPYTTPYALGRENRPPLA